MYSGAVYSTALPPAPMVFYYVTTFCIIKPSLVKHIFDSKLKTLGCPTKSTPAWGTRLNFINDILAQGVSIVKSWQNILDESSDILWKLIWTTLSGTVKICGGAVFIITAAEPVLESLWCALFKGDIESYSIFLLFQPWVVTWLKKNMLPSSSMRVND